MKVVHISTISGIVWGPRSRTSWRNVSERLLPKIPEKMSLFGEEIQLDNFDIRERLDKEIIVNTYYHSSTIQILKKANRYFPMIEKILAEEGVPDELKYLAMIESGLNPGAKSWARAVGMWQFIRATGKVTITILTML